MAEFYLGLQENIEEIFSAVDYLVEQKSSLESRFLAKAAETLELTGDYEGAFHLYVDAVEKSSHSNDKVDWQMEAAGLALLMGETEKGETLLDEIFPLSGTGRQKAMVLLLLSRTYFYQGKEAQALKALNDSLAETILPEALFWKDQLGEAGGEASHLTEVFPDSLLSDLQQGRVNAKTEPLNWGLAAPERNTPPPAASERGTAEPETVTVSETPRDETVLPLKKAIQTGSFVDEDNARELQKDLERLGYQVEIRRAERNDRTYHRVMIVGIEESGLGDELRKLRDRGYDGFITQ